MRIKGVKCWIYQNANIKCVCESTPNCQYLCGCENAIAYPAKVARAMEAICKEASGRLVTIAEWNRLNAALAKLERAVGK